MSSNWLNREIHPGTVSKTKGLGEVAFSDDGLDGKARYVSEGSFLDAAGTWRLHGLVEFGALAKHHSKLAEFPVSPHL